MPIPAHHEFKKYSFILMFAFANSALPQDIDFKNAENIIKLPIDNFNVNKGNVEVKLGFVESLTLMGDLSNFSNTHILIYNNKLKVNFSACTIIPIKPEQITYQSFIGTTVKVKNIPSDILERAKFTNCAVVEASPLRKVIGLKEPDPHI